MSIDRFVITLRHAGEGKTEERHWSKENVMHSMAWLKRMNARGYDVLIRPNGEHGLVLLDGLTKAQLDTLHQRGFGPAVVVDADREHYQAWVRLSLAPISVTTQEQAVQALRKGLALPTGRGGSPKDGHLAGLTNRSGRFQSDAQPYALLIEASGKTAPAAAAFLQIIQQTTVKERERLAKQRGISHGRSR